MIGWRKLRHGEASVAFIDGHNSEVADAMFYTPNISVDGGLGGWEGGDARTDRCIGAWKAMVTSRSDLSAAKREVLLQWKVAEGNK